MFLMRYSGKNSLNSKSDFKKIHLGKRFFLSEKISTIFNLVRISKILSEFSNFLLKISSFNGFFFSILITPISSVLKNIAIRLDSISALKILFELTYSEKKRIVIVTIWAIANTGWEGAINRLIELQNHPDKEISNTAEAALDEFFMLDEDFDDDFDEDFDEDF